MKLRAVVTAVMLVIGYTMVYTPLSGDIDKTEKELKKERKRLQLADEIDHLRKQYSTFKDRLPQNVDANEWVHYVLDGVRQLPLKLAKLDSEDSRDIGPYKAVVLRLELEGTYGAMDALLNWFETNQRLFRVDVVKVAPHRGGNGALVMQLVVLGVMG